MIFVEYLEDQHYEDVLYCVLDYLNLRHSPFIPFYSVVARGKSSSLRFIVGDVWVGEENLFRHRRRVLVDPD